MTIARGTVTKPKQGEILVAGTSRNKDKIARYDPEKYPDFQVGDLVQFTMGQEAVNVRLINRPKGLQKRW